MVYQDIISSTLDENLLRWQGIQATLEIAKSENSKVVVIGSGEQGLPIILGNQ
jgi:regulator of protease activity HflC (stomatin/prohibitin superfamily)